MTLEEPKFSTWGSLRPRNHGEPIKTTALREKLVETCSAVADHISQVCRKRQQQYLPSYTPPVLSSTKCTLFIGRLYVLDSTAQHRAIVPKGFSGQYSQDPMFPSKKECGASTVEHKARKLSRLASKG